MQNTVANTEKVSVFILAKSSVIKIALISEARTIGAPPPDIETRTHRKAISIRLFAVRDVLSRPRNPESKEQAIVT